ncbi:18819_t:CDS:2 [Funneliformis geosporum]|uniref:5199_t:CDS:1 n=1 Tax=Funneliformis geosporum TaxID=1117311 RepID=A0A9W4SGI7_9GLOM|nr:5199_t:CDS:2 [Funneliformis geosporum]CAI2171403.1 18819_t:CDS:2 [Funneliformis geosporum]
MNDNRFSETRRGKSDFIQEHVNSRFSKTEENKHCEFGLDDPNIIVGRYLIYDSRTRRCYARNNSSIEISTPRDGKHISKMLNAILGRESPNSMKEATCHSSLSRPIPPPPPPPNSPPLLSLSPFFPSSPELPSTPRGPPQVIQATPDNTPQQILNLQHLNTLTDNNSPPYSPFPDSHFAQFDVPSPPVSARGFSPISNPYYSDDSESSYSNASVHHSPTTPLPTIEISSPSAQHHSQNLRNFNESYDYLNNAPSRNVHDSNLIHHNELSPSPNNYQINSISTGRSTRLKIDSLNFNEDTIDYSSSTVSKEPDAFNRN